MPELPEVEAARRAAEAHLVGRRILSVAVAEDEKVLEGCSAEEVRAALVGKVVTGAGRKGKHLWLMLDQPPMPLFHFGMAGRFAIRGENVVQYKRLAVPPADEWPPKFHKLVLQAEGGVQLAFTDARRFGHIRLAPDPLLAPPVAQLGPDVLLALPSPSDFASLLRQRSRAVKAVLMDQAVLSGIGNWLADEVLYQARLHPEALSSRLSDAHCTALHSAIQQVIALSVAVDADSDRFPPSWLFHVRWAKKPGSIDGHKLSFITVGGRTSAIVPALQKLPVDAKTAATGRAASSGGGRRGTRRGDEAAAAAQAEAAVEAATEAAAAAAAATSAVAAAAAVGTARGRGRAAGRGAKGGGGGKRRRVKEEHEEDEEDKEEEEEEVEERGGGGKEEKDGGVKRRGRRKDVNGGGTASGKKRRQRTGGSDSVAVKGSDSVIAKGSAAAKEERAARAARRGGVSRL